MSRYAAKGELDAPQAPAGDLLFLGVNNRLAADKVPPGLAAHLQNYRTRDGTCDPRLGCIKPGWLNQTAAGVNSAIRPVTGFYGAGLFQVPNGLEWTILAAEGNVYRCRPNNERFSLTLPPGVQVSGRCVPVQAFNLLYLFRGRELAPLMLVDLDTGFEDIEPHWDAATQYDAGIQSIEQLADEIAYGPFQAVSSLTRKGTKATVVTPVEHGFIVGADITITGADQAEYNGRFTIIAVVDVFTFVYAFAGSATATATGTITCSNMRNYWMALGSLVTLISLTSTGTRPPPARRRTVSPPASM